MQPIPLQHYLAKLQDYHAAQNVIPSLSELGNLWDLKAKSWVHRIVTRLKEEQFLEAAPGRRLRPGTRFFERTIAAIVRAGVPQEAHDLSPDTMTIDHFLIEKPSQTVLFRVKGDSMIDASIEEGDFVVIERRSAALPGQIVLAIVDGEFTLKYLARDKQGYYLEAANKNYAPIHAQDRLEIYGVMVGMFRKILAVRI